jgi:hypothetical protein
MINRLKVARLTAIHLLFASAVHAADKNWAVGSGNWNVWENWAGSGGPPQEGESVLIRYNTGYPIGVVNYVNAGNPTLSSVEIDSEGQNWLGFVQEQDTLTTNYLTVGNSSYRLGGTGNLVVNNNFTLGTYQFSLGQFLQENGNVSISGGYGALTLGRDEGSEGRYDLTGGNLTLLGNEE